MACKLRMVHSKLDCESLDVKKLGTCYWMSCNIRDLQKCQISSLKGEIKSGEQQVKPFLLHSIRHLFRPYIAFAFSSTDIVEELLDSSRLINSN